MEQAVILCVDDDELILSSLRAQLYRQLGDAYNIELAVGGEEALTIIHELEVEQIDIPVILSDQIMPRMPGDQFLIQAHQRLPNSFKILLTGQHQMQAVTNAVNHANLYRYIAKPWDETDLLLTVQEALHSYQQRQQLQEQQRHLTETNAKLVQSLAKLQATLDTTNILKEREAQLEASNQELARITRLKDEFLATMSHELRTPLNAILGMTEALQEEIFGELNLGQNHAIQTVERSGIHLLTLINDILDVAKIESAQLELDLVPTDIAPLCQSSLAFVEQQALKKRIQLQSQLPSDLPNVLLDKQRVRQVMLNLLNNAIKFTPEGGQVSLEVSCPVLAPDLGPAHAFPPQVLRIAVIDTGIGIAPQQLSNLFEPFFQADSALNRKHDGTGLGLALVKRIVDHHDGQVRVTSEVGVGSCFIVDLPYIAA